ncbi:alkaline phosphatase D family protein [Aquabacterium sp. J223]|uniref:alkaline phosphatase D family protein n=1 Tax=Aquabacterium sp. J223 TaxID=2898431 RepID=UPI0021AE0797|nr:alkaline phosphatase D family protein [Aquabacterium sp. J223]UUX96099.1 alkaline phosphatase D family protein [Aquabacterium sp. J223]
MTASRRSLLQAALAAGLAPGLLSCARAGSDERFALGVASGAPRPDRLVLWTRLMGGDLPEAVPVRWQLARDERFTDLAAQGEETALRRDAHSVHAEPAGLVPGRPYFYRFEALGQRSAVGRTRTAPAPDAPAGLRYVIASCQRYDMGHYAAWRDVAEWSPDLVLFLGDYVYEYASAPNRVRRHEGGFVTSLDDYRRRYATYKRDPLLQAAHAAAPWLLVWDDHEVDNDYAALQGQALQPDFAERRAAAYQAWWEHQPVPRAWRPRGPDLRIVSRWTWGRLATVHCLDDRQYRDPQACPKPGRGGSNNVALRDCPELLDPQRSLLGHEQERWLADGWDLQRPWNLVAQQTLMSRFAWRDPARDPAYWTDGWDGYPAARRRLLDGIAERRLPGAVVLGGDVHTHYVAELRPDFDRPGPAVASEFCGTSISSPSMAQARLDEALPFNPHIRLGRSDHRGTVRFTLDERRLQAELRAVEDVERADSPVNTLARFIVEAGRPGPQPA